VSDLVGEEAPSLEDVVGGKKGSDSPKKLHRHPRIEHDRHLLCGEWRRAQFFHRSLRRALSDPRRLELPETTSGLAVVADLPIAVL
jgi:hypothetical protein